ncbi:curli production assembly/transport component CsgF [Belliella aquatica]|uniref:Curli production assembly/transport component CsgF n=1 Tax=Belliella aquatica TaxID=1323734 RepID=A0ABQ1MED2_9BACT|nr:curli production assembly/transport component CsgF [Belliella aquatica]MCH7405147.1 curli assembly protein CsgF [Belliella aquatica]GGC39378.1 curli production assembly protein CsgF [Belliella aquatica]
MNKLLLLSVFLFFGIASESLAQQFVYQPKNPAFGGNTFNYQWMLSSAQTQDTNVDPNVQSRNQAGLQRDPLLEFSESLNRQILSRLSRELVTRQFGSESLEEGSFLLGDFQIDINDGGNGLSITIVDTSTGATTVVEVPFN